MTPHEKTLANYPNLSKANLSKADLSKADLRDADLSEADLSKADLRKADLRKADLYKANLRDADLRDADLSDASLYKASLYKANLSWANLSWANLSKSDLRFAKGIVRLEFEGYTLLIQPELELAHIGCMTKSINDWLALSDEQAMALGSRVKIEHIPIYRGILEMFKE